ncbi:hypothetical protein GCT13_35045 [Paraburkholderia sp. CNPSo 3157]|uniref:Uncharacterized protein n=1 Tax=Paraburkholderia franconis TaxID=2654983 RepID=A0A7X1NI41_9BURK|nr:hypothetical protein [Paraburkholderia franconis]MPW21938.1 hypothetical protein [Paraburkholderia franconis]
MLERIDLAVLNFPREFVTTMLPELVTALMAFFFAFYVPQLDKTGKLGIDFRRACQSPDRAEADGQQR